MSTKTLELRTLDDEELLDVVGGWGDHCGDHRDDCWDRDRDRCCGGGGDFDRDFVWCFL